MKKMMKLVLNDRGLSLIEILALMVSFGLAASAVFTTIKSMSTKKDAVKRTEDIVYLNNLISNKVRSVFTHTVGTGGKKTQGVCSKIVPLNFDERIHH